MLKTGIRSWEEKLFSCFLQRAIADKACKSFWKALCCQASFTPPELTDVLITRDPFGWNLLFKPFFKESSLTQMKTCIGEVASLLHQREEKASPSCLKFSCIPPQVFFSITDFTRPQGCFLYFTSAETLRNRTQQWRKRSILLGSTVIAEISYQRQAPSLCP